MGGPAPAVAEIRLAVRRALSGLAAGDLVLVACSGGADSLALADGLAFEAPRAGLRAGGVTVDHGLAPGSAERARSVGARLRDLGLEPVEVVRVEVGSEGGPEAAARSARYRALDDAAVRLGASAVLLGHTRDDQAETVLLGLARGSGARSLAGMRPAAGRYRRPLLDLDRVTTRRACAAAGLSFWDDPQNADPAFARTRVRQSALPMLEQALGPGVAEALARTARLLRDDADALDAWADRATGDCAHPAGGLSVTCLTALPAAVRRRILRRAAVDAGSPAGSLSAVHIEALDRLITAWHGQGPTHIPGGIRAERQSDRILMTASGDASDPASPEAGSGSG